MRSRLVVCAAVLVACGNVSETRDPFSPTSAPTGVDAGDDDGTAADDANDDDPSHASDEGEDAGSGSSDGADDRGESSDGGDATSGGTTGGGDPNCYSEPLDPDAAVDDIVDAYGGAGYKAQVIEAMGRRWPGGAFLLQEQIDDSYWGQFSDSNSWSGMVGWLDTLVHEQTHLFNAYHAIDVGENAALYFGEDRILYLPNDQGFPRSEILPHLIAGAQSGNYASTYLVGSQGDRLFHPLLDEANAYANEVPGLAVFGEYFDGFGLSLRDGSAAFLYFLEVYLRIGRTEHPEWYAWAQGQPVYLEAVELLWLRTHFFYEAVADGYPSLGIDDAMYRAAAYEAENLAELEMFTGKAFGASSCIDP